MSHCAEDRIAVKKWVDGWRDAGSELKRIGRQELRRFKYEENRALVDALLQIGSTFGFPRQTSGLVELQRWFARLRR